MFAHTLPSGRKLRQRLLLTSLLHPEPCHRLISFICSPQPTNNSLPAFNSSADPSSSSSLPPLIIVSLSPEALGLDEMKTVSNNYSFPLLLLSPVLPLGRTSTINGALHQACEKLLTLTNYDTLGGKHAIKTRRLFT